MTYEVMSAETGLSKAAILRVMNNTLSKVDVSTLNTLCRYFDCTVGDILEYVPDEEPAA